MNIQNHSALVQAYKEYMETRHFAKQGMMGAGAVSIARDKLRAVYCFLSGKEFKESWQIALNH